MLDKTLDLGCDLAVNAKQEDPVLAVNVWTCGHGADAILYTAASSDASFISQYFKMSRRKGRVVIVGVAPLLIDRSDMYSKVIDLLISSSYGPGRYDDKYELEGIDYPYAYVRWTENRNIQEFLRLIRVGQVRIEPLQPNIYPSNDVSRAYSDLEQNPSTHLISLISYGEPHKEESGARPAYLTNTSSTVRHGAINIGLIGAGGFATGQLLPIITALKDKFVLQTIANRNGEKAKNAAHQFGAEIATSDYKDILADDRVDLVMICTRHNSHASMVVEALQAGKHVYVEKPLATTIKEIDLIESLYRKGLVKTQLFVGFNRRFSQHTQEILKHISQRQSPSVCKVQDERRIHPIRYMGS